MVGPALQRVTSAGDLAQEEQHVEKHHWQAYPRAAPHSNSHHRQQQTRHFPGGDSGKRNGQKGGKGSDHRIGALDVSGRSSLPSASSSGRAPHSNLDCFLEVTTPIVKSQTLRKSCLRDSSQKRCFNPEVTPFFSLGDLWDSFDEWSAYGAGVPLVLSGEESAVQSVVQYYVPYLSALQLYTLPSRRPDWPVGYRHPGSESDEGSEASSDGESERSMGQGRPFRGREYKGADSPPPNLGSPLGGRLECSTFINDDDEEGEVWSYFEHSPPYSRVPLVDKIADLSRDFKPDYNPLRILRSVDLLPKSWLSVAWYPIYRIPTGPTLRDLAACFLTFHSLSTPLQGEADDAMGASLRQVCGNDVCALPTMTPLDSQRLALRAFGLASYKLRGTVWTSSRQASTLQNSADDHLKQLDVQHPDFNFFTSHSNPTRR